MSDEVVTSGVSAFEPSADAGQAQTSAETPSTSDSGGVAVKQASTKVNLNDLPEYREIQSKRDREAQALRNELNQLKSEREAQQLAAMSPDKRAEFLANKYKAELDEVKEQTAREKYEQEKAAGIEQIHKEHGVPKSLLAKAENETEALQIAEEWKRELKQAARNFEEKVQRNAPDTGGGGHAKSASQKDVRIQQAVESGDPVEILRAMRGAD